MQQTILFRAFIFLWLLVLGQAIPINESNRSDSFCCTSGLGYSTAIDACFEWNKCEGRYTSCTTNAHEAALCSQCLQNPLKDSCQEPFNQNKRDLDLGHEDLDSEHTILPREAAP